MKTKLKSLLALSLLMIFMSSCVYSLFPIYTEDTLVYLPELEGKWQLGDDPDDYILFEPAVGIEASIQVTETENEEPSEKTEVTITEKKYTFDFGDDEFIVVDGDTIRDREKIKAYYKQQLDTAMKEMGNALKETFEGLGKAFKQVKNTPNPLSYSKGQQAYKMTVKNDGDLLVYQVHLAQIGDDLFMDLYPDDADYAEAAFGSMVWFPVHTFMKIELDGDQLKLTQFDLEKMNKLFDSNLIRMSHENVDGTILITAQPEEIQKFLKKYSRDESVYEGEEIYSRVAE